VVLPYPLVEHQRDNLARLPQRRSAIDQQPLRLVNISLAVPVDRETMTRARSGLAPDGTRGSTATTDTVTKPAMFCSAAPASSAIRCPSPVAVRAPRTSIASASGWTSCSRPRHRSSGNSLNRAALQTAKALDQSLAQPLPTVAAEQPVSVDYPPANEAPVDAGHDTAGPLVLDERNKRIWAAAIIDSMRKLGLPVDLLTRQPPPLPP
jgi:hypothetical protein